MKNMGRVLGTVLALVCGTPVGMWIPTRSSDDVTLTRRSKVRSVSFHPYTEWLDSSRYYPERSTAWWRAASSSDGSQYRAGSCTLKDTTIYFIRRG